MHPLTESGTAGDLFGLADALAASAGGAVAIEDLDQRVLAYSTLPGQPIDEERRDGILGRRVPQLPGNPEQYAAVFRAAGAITVPGRRPELDRLAIAVRDGDRNLGSIWLVVPETGLAADAPAVLAHAADLARQHLQRAAEPRSNERAESLRALLRGEAGGAGEAGPVQLLAVRPAAPTRRLTELVAMLAGLHRRSARCAELEGTVYALFPEHAGDLEPLAARIAERTRAAGTAVHVVLGSVERDPGQLAAARAELDAALNLLAADAASPAVHSVGRLHSALLLSELAETVHPGARLFPEPARRMLEADARGGSEYAKTVLTYLECGRDFAAASGRLSIHQNTLRHRLRRAHELFGADLADPDLTLTLWLALRATPR